MLQDQLRLDGKVALVTGAARGIGLAISQALAEQGCSIALQDLDHDLARDQAKEFPTRSIGLGGDMTDVSLPDRLFEQTTRELGGLHIIVNNAGVQAQQSWTHLTQDDFDRILYANVLAPLRLAQLAEPIFKRQGWGRIVNIGSVQQTSGNPLMLPYSMSKAAMENLTTGLAQDLGKHGVTVNLIAPGFFDTARNQRHFATEEAKARFGQRWPIPRIGQPRDCAGLAVLLCSDAASYITGQTIFVDGGMQL